MKRQSQYVFQLVAIAILAAFAMTVQMPLAATAQFLAFTVGWSFALVAAFAAILTVVSVVAFEVATKGKISEGVFSLTERQALVSGLRSHVVTTRKMPASLMGLIIVRNLVFAYAWHVMTYNHISLFIVGATLVSAVCLLAYKVQERKALDAILTLDPNAWKELRTA